jgi:hypothetical protein
VTELLIVAGGLALFVAAMRMLERIEHPTRRAPAPPGSDPDPRPDFEYRDSEPGNGFTFNGRHRS